MYFKSSLRNNPDTNSLSAYYRLVESYRNSDNRICHHTILTVGFIDDLVPEQLNIIQKVLTNKSKGKAELFNQTDSLVIKYIDLFWARVIAEKRIALPEVAKEKRKALVYEDNIKYKDVREIGAEWMGYQALAQLGLSDFLKNR